MNALRVRCLSELEDVLALREQIDTLNLACDSPDAFSTSDFYENFVQRGLLLPQTDVQLWFLIALDGDALVGYLPLKRLTRKVLGASCPGLEFLVGHQADQPHLVARAEHCAPVARAMYAYLLRRGDQWSWLELQGQAVDSLLDPARLGLRLPGCKVSSFANWENCSIPIAWGSVQQYVQAMSKNMRGELRRRLRRLLSLGNVELLASADPRATPALFDLYCSIEQRSWKSQTDVAIGNAVGADYLRGLLDARQPMRILIQILLLDGVPIAGLICGSFSTRTTKTLYALHLAYDNRFASTSPGSAVLLMGIRYAIEHQHACVNLLAGFAYYKTRWLAQTTPLHSIQIYRIGTLLFWRRLLGDAWRWLRRSQPAVATSDRLQVLEHASDAPQLRDADRQQFAAQIVQALSGTCETWTAAEIASSAGIAVPVAERVTPPPRDLSDKGGAVRGRLPKQRLAGVVPTTE